MPLITRQEKGSKLTIQEMDGNLTYLESNGFIDGTYEQSKTGTGAIIDLTVLSSPLFTDGAEGVYEVTPTSEFGSGAILNLAVIPVEGGYNINFIDSEIIEGGSGYVEKSAITFSSNDFGGTLDKTVSIDLSTGSVDVDASSSIAVSTSEGITLDTSLSITITGNGIPTSDPGVSGQLWVDADNGYVLKVSQG